MVRPLQPPFADEGCREAVIEAEATLRLVSALAGRAGRPELESVLSDPDLALVFPAFGIPRRTGIEYLRAVGNPERLSALDEPGRAAVGYLSELVGRSEAITALLGRLSAGEPDLAARAFKRTQEFLPAGCEQGEPRLVLLPLLYDCRTDRETVYIDPLAALALGPEGIRHTLSHELHHVARYRLTGEALTLMRPGVRAPPRDARAAFVEWAAWLEAEGIADCASNMTETDVPALRTAAMHRREQMATYETLLSEILGRFEEQAARSPVDPAGMEPLMADALGLAHPLGCRMAGAVDAGLGRTALVECVGRPGTFLARYNEAARRASLTPVGKSFVGWLSPPHAGSHGIDATDA